MECFRLLFDHLAWIEHEFLSGIRDSRKAGSLWGMMRGVRGVRKSIHQIWLAKGLGLLCWGFKEVQEEIPSEEASTLQICSVAFPPGQYTSPLTEEVFHGAFQKLLERYNMCVLSIKVPIRKKKLTVWPINSGVLTTLLLPHISSSLTNSLPSLNLLCHSKTHAWFMPEAFHMFLWYFFLV